MMQTYLHNLGALAVALFLTGCGTTHGPVPTMGIDGPWRQDATKGVVKAFFDSEKASQDKPSDANLAHMMLTNGFTVVYVNCVDFFASAGDTQKWIVFARDTIGAVGTIGTSVLALHNGSRNAVSNFALATAIGYSGLDIYTKNFLFAAENVESVRTLVANALTEHKKAVLSLEPFIYQSATVHILDNQNICTPAAITALAREAIKKGDVAAAITGSPGGANVRQLGDQAVLQQLGAVLNPPGALTPDQAGALWWLLREFSTDAEKRTLVAPKLSGLPIASQPLDANGAYKPSWAQAEAVGKALDQFSGETKQLFRSSITAAQAASQPATPGGPAPAAAAGPRTPPPAPKFGIAVPGDPGRSSRVSIGIR